MRTTYVRTHCTVRPRKVIGQTGSYLERANDRIWEEPLNVFANSDFPEKDSKDDIIRVYITNLPRESKALLRAAGIDSPEISERSDSTFNYASFLQRIELQGLYEVITSWIIGSKCYVSRRYSETQERRLLLFRELCKLFVSQSPNLKFSIILDVIKRDEFFHFQQLSDIIPSNSILEKLVGHTGHVREIYGSIGKTFSEIKNMNISCDVYDNMGLASLIDQMRENTWSLIISGTPGLSITESLKRKTHLLTSLEITSDEPFPEIFVKCQLLKTLIIHEAHESRVYPSILEAFANTSFIQLTEFCFYSEHPVKTSFISNIIRNTRKTIKSLRIITLYKEVLFTDPENFPLLLSFIPSDCPHLRELHIPFTKTTLDLMYNIFRVCNMLKIVILDWYDDPIEPQSEFFNWAENLGKSIPLSLISLRVKGCMGFNVEATDRLLDLCFRRKIKSLKLTIDDWTFSEYFGELIEVIDKYILQGTLHANSRLTLRRGFNVM
ncbi:15399_t:CDS:2 [Acaulospora colombiana]|uniref:15399_t:CDS:1 n=1 Tax=Acaulospora colombiana TaxID=27376 RepID=A0ACA9L1L8_9GLOM|nr:15399_t:CDS:2 [Acaulospora colombiana]